MNVTESYVQSVLMGWALDVKNHQIAVPNVTVINAWECDLLTVTQSGLSHEFEIKTSRTDFLRDRRKKFKHSRLRLGDASTSSNYFWYVTCGFDNLEIHEVPAYAGWITIRQKKVLTDIEIVRKAPRLHTKKVSQKDLLTMGRLLAYRLKNEYREKYL